ncbi:hypothetical protein [Phnomibacter ginsenosidimutans]|nr:hypothetical protein [Phnomibacter ginsenosidimutans]
MARMLCVDEFTSVKVWDFACPIINNNAVPDINEYLTDCLMCVDSCA